MYLNDSKPNFRPVKPRSNLYRVMILLVLIGVGYYIIQGVWVRQDIEPLFLPTPTPTRTAYSYEMEGDTQFTAGNLDAAIAAYQEATRLEPNNGELWSRLARIQTYSSNLLTTSKDQLARLTEALNSINKAVEAAPDDSEVRAIRAFVLDWNALPDLVGADQAERYLTEAQQEAGYALQLDPSNTLALAFYAEILVDQQKWQQAEQYIEQAVQRDDSLMDVHRIYAYVKETSADYEGAIEEYKKAVEITPNLTFLYIKIGVTYRHLEQYDLALEYFAKAADIDTQLGVKDPLPYISIAKTYSQMPSADFFAAALNIKKALYLDPTNPNTYGQLGIIYDHGRNFEGSLPAFKCATQGCTVEESCEVLDCENTGMEGVQVEGMPLDGNSYVYYYTYASVLAALNTRTNPSCQQALPILAQLRQAYGNDDNIMSIVRESEAICSDTPSSSTGETVTPTPGESENQTPIPEVMVTPTPKSAGK